MFKTQELIQLYDAVLIEMPYLSGWKLHSD